MHIYREGYKGNTGQLDKDLTVRDIGQLDKDLTVRDIGQLIGRGDISLVSRRGRSRLPSIGPSL